ncbi:anti-sigma factor family protein [Luteibacter yeojuensis]|uniref:Zf-HC2 domain-containing protein n=1 Tax=Luteibacter yeojuensis TaxID=345309 RepID=A0A7X5QV22_9GAMM|nr:zf-HC2 domain-containing protein [Luteibacter yeojuensis]NID15952.1 zf-HC2 domain-containing protein [Luteibacter yeojuensis]
MTLHKDAGRDCTRAWEAMPWVLRGDAPAEQDDWLKAHLASCPACREEFAQQERLREALSLPSDLPIDAEAGLARLMARIDDAETRPAATRRFASSGWLVRGLLAAVLVQAVGIGVLGIKLRGEDRPAPAYRTLSQPEAPVAPGSLRVVPQSTMKVAEWNTLLQDLHLRVTGGPNDVGAYTLVSEDGKAASGETLKRLRATPGIRFAEPVAGAP